MDWNALLVTIHITLYLKVKQFIIALIIGEVANVNEAPRYLLISYLIGSLDRHW